MAWEQARSSDSARGYESFLKRYPESLHKAEVQQRLEDISWEQARSSDTTKEYESFLKRYPESLHKAEAQQRLEDISWGQARSKESTWKYQQFLARFPTSRHAEEAQTRLRLVEFESVSRSHASAKSKQEFIAKYRGTEEAARVSKDLEGMAIVDMEYPKSITPTGSSSNPTWEFRIVFHERNGVAARINCTSLGGSNWKERWCSHRLSRAIFTFLQMALVHTTLGYGENHYEEAALPFPSVSKTRTAIRRLRRHHLLSND